MLKDELLNTLAHHGANIAQFASFGPENTSRFLRVKDQTGKKPKSVLEATECLLKNSNSGTVNIRTFLANKPDGNPFEYGLSDPKTIAEKIEGYINKGFFVILNETIPIDDGGFSGVLFGGRMEGAPNDTPRCVEKPDCMILSRAMGFNLIKKVYGFDFHMPFDRDYRVEFSVHPPEKGRKGYAYDHQIIWQADQYPQIAVPQGSPSPTWPNKYSHMLGDKAFGLLIADLLGFPVPRTNYFSRSLPIITLGTATQSNEPVWLRTVPREQTPGKFQTKRGWIDPFKMMREDDPTEKLIAGILVQEGVPAAYSGSAISNKNGRLIVEGCQGYGDEFMVGKKEMTTLPKRVQGEINFIYDRLKEALGEVRFEWVFDGSKVWVLQLHRGTSETQEDEIYPGSPKEWVDFKPADGLEVLRALAKEVEGKNIGIIVRGNVGITSHIGDILRKSKITSKRIISKSQTVV